MVQCACIQSYHMINLNTHTWHHFSGSMFEKKNQTGQKNFRFQIDFQISKLDLGFQINLNGFSRDRSFQHKNVNLKKFINFQKKMKIFTQNESFLQQTISF